MSLSKVFDLLSLLAGSAACFEILSVLIALKQLSTSLVSISSILDPISFRAKLEMWFLMKSLGFLKIVNLGEFNELF